MQTATLFFILALAALRASAPRIQNRQEGTMRLEAKKRVRLLTRHREGLEGVFYIKGVHWHAPRFAPQ